MTLTPVGPPLEGSGSSAARIPDDGSIGAQLVRALRAGPPHASNWELVSAKHSTNGHPIAVMGPQVGYYVPQILMEVDLHGPGIDARGAAFPGVNLYVQLGHGRDYAWSATTATSDNVDTFAEVLCQDDVHYLYKGQCRAMERLDRNNSWTPNGGDQTPPGSETLTALRTVHGIVYARGTVKGKKVAFVSSRTTYFHEADSALGFIQLNDPNFLTSPQRFQQAASNINFAFNWAYVDSKHIAYYLSGWYPQRAARTSPDFPVLGTGEFDWQGYNPEDHTLNALPFAKHPNAIDPPYLISWNGKQAPGWAAADDMYAYGPLQRMQLIRNHVRAALRKGRKMSINRARQRDGGAGERGHPLRAAVADAAQGARAVRPIPSCATPSPCSTAGTRPAATAATSTATATNENDDAITADGRVVAEAARRRVPLRPGRRRLQGAGQDARHGQHRRRPIPPRPAFFDGWWGYASKDLRGLLSKPVRVCQHVRGRARCARRTPAGAPKVRGRWSRVFCGNGSLKTCRAALRASLRDALSVSRQDVYGAGDCKSNPQSSCFDRNRFTIASAIDLPPFPLQNRPTFQQVVELTRSAGR